MDHSLISIKNLNYQIPYGKQILKDVTLSVLPGEFIGLLGKNGQGKTTLIELILGMRTPTSGEVKLLGKDYNDENRPEELSFLSHDLQLQGNLSVREFLDFNAAFYKKYSKEKEREYLDYFQIDEKNKIASFSTGGQKKVQIVAALSSRPKILIIDEITAVLDPSSRAQLFQALLNEQLEHKLTIFLATNIAEDLINRASKILYIDQTLVSEHQSDKILDLFKNINNGVTNA